MDMTLRWYGPGYDSVTLKQIRQIPGVKNVITTLFGKQAGERWLPEEIAELKRIVEDAGLGIAGIVMAGKDAILVDFFLPHDERSSLLERIKTDYILSSTNQYILADEHAIIIAGADHDNAASYTALLNQ